MSKVPRVALHQPQEMLRVRNCSPGRCEKESGMTQTTDPELMRAFADGQPIGKIRPSLKRDLAFSVDDPSLSDAEFRNAVRRAVRNPWYD
jgi:hypothetical protein